MHRSGFTLVEILLSIAVIGVMLSIATPFTLSQVTSYNLEATRDTLVSFLNQSRTRAMANHNNADKGVYITPTSITAYSGPSYATRDQSFDVVSQVPSSLTMVGATEIHFTRLTGVTSPTSVIVQTPLKNYSVFVNAEGSVDW